MGTIYFKKQSILATHGPLLYYPCDMWAVKLGMRAVTPGVRVVTLGVSADTLGVWLVTLGGWVVTMGRYRDMPYREAIVFEQTLELVSAGTTT